jgi:hypothetical protein
MKKTTNDERRSRIEEIAKRRNVPVPGCAGLTQEQLDRNMAQAILDAANDSDDGEGAPENDDISC